MREEGDIHLHKGMRRRSKRTAAAVESFRNKVATLERERERESLLVRFHEGDLLRARRCA